MSFFDNINNNCNNNFMKDNSNAINNITPKTLKKSLSEKKYLVCKKITNCENKDDILTDVDQCFFRATKFLDTKTNIIIGKLPQNYPCEKKNEFSPCSSAGPHKIVKNNNSFSSMPINNVSTRENSGKIKVKFNRNNKLHTYSNNINYNINNNNPSHKLRLTYDVIDDNSAKKIFDHIKENIKTNSDINNKYDSQMLNKLPINLRKSLEKQQKNLYLKQREDLLKSKLIDYLMNKTKKTEEDILLNGIDTITLRRHIIDRAYSHNPVVGANMDPIYKWILSLREFRKKKLNEIRERVNNNRQYSSDIGRNNININLHNNNYNNNSNNHQIFFDNNNIVEEVEDEIKKDKGLMMVNIRHSNDDPLFASVKQKGGILREIVLKPDLKSTKSIKKFTDNPYLQKFDPNGDFGLSKVKSLSSLHISGVNLLNYESENECAIKGKKRLYKTNLLESLRISAKNPIDFENKLGQILDDKVFVENYDMNIYSNNKQSYKINY